VPPKVNLNKNQGLRLKTQLYGSAPTTWLGSACQEPENKQALIRLTDGAHFLGATITHFFVGA